MTELSDRLDTSAKKRATLLRRFGFVPVSILKLSRGKLHRSLYHLAKEKKRANITEQTDSIRKTEAGRATAAERRRAGVMDAPYTESSNRDAISIMAAELVDFCCEYYLPNGGVYLDPFVGQGVQAQVAAIRKLSYYGSDISAEYVDFTNSTLERYEYETTIDVRRADSRDPSWIEHGIGDFSFSSPPYWDIEFYSDDEEQLGLDSTYEEFLDGLLDVYAAWLPKFRAGATVVVNVNDFRRDGRFYPYHSDLIAGLRNVGYEPWDLWVVEGLIGGLPRAFAVQSNTDRRQAPKVHEYLLVFRVPG